MPFKIGPLLTSIASGSLSCVYLPHLERLFVVKSGYCKLIAPTPEGTFLFQSVVEDLSPKAGQIKVELPRSRVGSGVARAKAKIG